jgi:hypothetical protein
LFQLLSVTSKNNFQNEINVSIQGFNRAFSYQFPYRILSLFAIIAFVFLVQSAPTFNKGKINCCITYLKGINFLDSAYPEFDEYSDNCDESVEALKNHIYKKFSLSIKPKDFSEVASCIRNDLRWKHWVAGNMFSSVCDSSESLAREGNNSNTAPLGEDIQRKARLEFTTCVNEETFGKMFDTSYKTADQYPDEDPFKDYCKRKYVVDAGFAETSKFNFSVNPNNLDVSNVDCEPYKKNALGEFAPMMLSLALSAKNFGFHSKEEKKVNCAMEKYHAKELQDKLFRLEAIRFINLSDEEKVVERKNCINVLIEMVDLVNECMNDFE